MENSNSFFHITNKKLDLPFGFPDIPSMGGYVLFAGIVRNINDDKQVTHLEYEAYWELAHRMVAEILKDAREKWKLEYAECTHRVGKLNIGEVAVFVMTGSVHRDEAYKANRYIIDRVKHEVPIWKKEYYLDGSSEWSKGCQEEGHEH